jgi:hypothetical protein
MGKASLVEQDIEEGRRLVDLLVQSGEKVPVALWRYDSTHGDWRLVLAVPQMARSPQEAYNFLRNVLKGMRPPVHLSLSDITLISPNGGLVKALQREKNSARALRDRFLSGTRIGDAYFEGVYLYKVA